MAVRAALLSFLLLLRLAQCATPPSPTSCQPGDRNCIPPSPSSFVVTGTYPIEVSSSLRESWNRVYDYVRNLFVRNPIGALTTYNVQLATIGAGGTCTDPRSLTTDVHGLLLDCESGSPSPAQGFYTYPQNLLVASDGTIQSVSNGTNVSGNSSTAVYGSFTHLTAGDLTVTGPITAPNGTFNTMCTQQNNQYYVDAAFGNDTNCGTILSPWKTITHAYAYVKTFASPSTLTTVWLAPGKYSDNFAQIPNVILTCQIAGIPVGTRNCALTGTNITMDSTMFGDPNARFDWRFVTFQNALTIDLRGAAVHIGAVEVEFNKPVTVYTPGTSSYFWDCWFVDILTVVGSQMNLYRTVNEKTIYAADSGTADTNIFFYSPIYDDATPWLYANSTSFNTAISASGCAIGVGGAVTLDGANSKLKADSNCFNGLAVTLLNGAPSPTLFTNIRSSNLCLVPNGQYYVDFNHGSDSNCGTILDPLATINKAFQLANSSANSTTLTAVHLAPGRYTNGFTQIANVDLICDSWGAGYGTRECAISGTVSMDQGSMLNVAGARFSWRGITLVNTATIDLRTSQGGAHFNMEACTFAAATTIYSNSSSTTLQNCVFSSTLTLDGAQMTMIGTQFANTLTVLSNAGAANVFLHRSAFTGASPWLVGTLGSGGSILIVATGCALGTGTAVTLTGVTFKADDTCYDPSTLSASSSVITLNAGLPLAGTANEITLTFSSATGLTTASLPSALVAPGTFTATTSSTSPLYVQTGTLPSLNSFSNAACSGGATAPILVITGNAANYVLSLTTGDGTCSPNNNIVIVTNTVYTRCTVSANVNTNTNSLGKVVAVKNASNRNYLYTSSTLSPLTLYEWTMVCAMG